MSLAGEGRNGNGHGGSNGNSSKSWWSSLWRKQPPGDSLGPFRRVALQLHYDVLETRSVLVALPGNSQPGSEEATALACCLATELNRPVLLIDACLRVPAATLEMGAAALRGFVDLLRDETLRLEDLVLPTNHASLSFLPAGLAGGHSQPADAIERVLAVARTKFDFIVVCGGSIMHDALSLAMVPFVGSVLLCAQENRTKKEDLVAAQTALAACKARKVGVILNASGKRKSRRA